MARRFDPVFNALIAGDVPASGGGATNFLRADGTWAAPPVGGSGITGGAAHGVAITNTATSIASSIVLGANQLLVGAAAADPAAQTVAGDLTLSGGTFTIANSAVTNAKMANMAANTLKGNNTGSPAAPLDLTVAQVSTLLSLITTPSPTLKGGYPAWSDTTGKVLVDGKGRINVLAYGADPTGASDSTTAIQNAWNAAGPLQTPIYIPAGTYLIGSFGVGLTAPSNHGTGIIGDGAWSTILQTPASSVFSGNVITLANISAEHPVYKGFSITRATLPIASFTWAANVVTVTTAAPHGQVGTFPVTVLGASTTTGTADKTFGVATVTGASTFTYPLAGSGTMTGPGSYFVAPTAGNGIKTGLSCDDAVIDDIYVMGQFDALNLGQVGVGFVSNIFCERNSRGGVRLADTVTVGAGLTWNLTNIFVQKNGGVGIAAVGSSATHTNSLEQWLNVAGFLNALGGLSISGCTASRITNGFFGNDGFGAIWTSPGAGTFPEFSIDNANQSGAGAIFCHTLTGIQVEAGAGNGFFFGTNCFDYICLNNCAAMNCSAGAGIFFQSPQTIMVTNGNYQGNNPGASLGAGSASFMGVIIPGNGAINSSASGNLTVMGCKTGTITQTVGGAFTALGNYP